MNLTRSLLTLLLSAQLLTPLAARATPDYFTGQTDTPVEPVGTSGITATFSGGQSLYRTFTFIGGSTPLYGTTSQVAGYANPITITFSQPVSNVNALILNLSPNATTIATPQGPVAISAFGTKKLPLSSTAATSVTITAQDTDSTGGGGPIPGWNFAIVTNLTSDQGSIQFSGTPPPLPTGTTLAQIAFGGDQAPGSTANFSVFQSQPAISGNTVVFNTQLSDGGRGIYTGSGGATTLVADFNTPVPNGTGNFTGFGNIPSISGSTVAFRGGSSSGQAIYASSGGTLTTIADQATPIPGGSGNFSNFTTEPAISGSRIAFQATGASSQGVYLSSGGSLSAVADTSTAIPGGTGSFQSFGIPSVSGASAVFPGTGADPLGGTDVQLGIYRSTGGVLTTIADKNTPIPGGTGNFTSFGGASVSGTNVAFLGKGANGQAGIYLFSNGALTLIANGGTPIPDGALNFNNFSNPAISGSVVVFLGQGPWLQAGLYASQEGFLKKLVGANEPAPSGRTLGVPVIGSFALDGASVAFQVLLNGASGGRAIFRADLPAFGPNATTGAASQITRTAATVVGTVASGGAQATVTVEYDTDISDDDYAFSTTLSPVAATDAVSVSTTLTGLQPGTLYHYRVVAENSGGKVSGADATFTTAANATPVAVNDTATTRAGESVDIQVLANDTDADGDTLVVVGGGDASSGQVAGIENNDGAVIALRYVPADGFTGVATFIYTVTDGIATSNPATVTVTVTPPPIVDPVRTVLFSKGGGVPGAGVLNSGVPAGAVWVGFGPPAIDSASKVAFLGQWSAPSGRGAGIFVDGVLLVKVGDLLAGPGGNVFKSLRDPIFNLDGSGTVAFLATIQSPSGTFAAAVTNAPETAPNTPFAAPAAAPFSTQAPSYALQVVAFAGSAAPGTDGALFQSLRGLSLLKSSLAVSATLQPGTGKPRVTAGNDRGIWLFPRNGAEAVFIRKGMSFAGRVLQDFHALEATPGSAGAGRGELVDFLGAPALGFTARFSDGSQAQALQAAIGGGAIAETGPTDKLEPALTGATFASFGRLALALNPGFHIAFRALLTPGAGGVNGADDDGVFVANEGDTAFTLVARQGQVVGESGGASFSSFLDPVLNADGAMAFQAKLQGPGANGAHDDAIFYAPPRGSARLLAREGGQPPEAPAGAKWGRFLSLAMPDHAAGPLLLARLTNHYYNGYVNGRLRPGPGGVTMTSDVGLWGMGTGGELRLLLREGELLDGKRVASFTVLSTVLGSPGVTRSYDNAQDVVLRVFFTDLSQAIVRIQLPNAVDICQAGASLQFAFYDPNPQAILNTATR